VSFRQYRRTSSGIDAGIQAVGYALVILTAPIWVPVLLLFGAYQSCTAPERQAATAAREAQAEAARVAEQEAVRSRVPVSDIALSNLLIAPELDYPPSLRPRTSTRRLDGRLKNDSYFRVTAVGLNFTVKDCDAKECEQVGKGSARIDTSTPAGQARDFSTEIRLDGYPHARRGRLVWNYDVAFIEAQLDSPSKGDSR